MAMVSVGVAMVSVVVAMVSVVVAMVTTGAETLSAFHFFSEARANVGRLVVAMAIGGVLLSAIFSCQQAVLAHLARTRTHSLTSARTQMYTSARVRVVV